jgi:four helix bundle protein
MCEASKVALEFITSLVPLVAEIRIADPDLASQLRRAATSAALNTAEAWRRDGRDRAMRFRIAAAECAETAAALHVATRWRYVADDATAPALALADRLGAMLYRLQHPRR